MTRATLLTLLILPGVWLAVAGAAGSATPPQKPKPNVIVFTDDK